jgi:hypothetical protein
MLLYDCLRTHLPMTCILIMKKVRDAFAEQQETMSTRADT